MIDRAADGRALLAAAAALLAGCGGFAIVQAASGHFLPHDAVYLGITAPQLCALERCRILYFMIHDRISFGGVLVAIAVLYAWLALVPLRRRESRSYEPKRRSDPAMAIIRVLEILRLSVFVTQ